MRNRYSQLAGPEDFDARLFDERIERDAEAGKLDQLAAEARADHEINRCNVIPAQAGIHATLRT